MPATRAKTGKFIKLLLKIAITLACLWYVSTKINFNEIAAILEKADWWWLVIAFIAYSFSKIVGAHRLNIYFKNIGVRISDWASIKLYWLGMFYNLFLPGSITGDAYKVVLLSKRFGISYKKLSAAVLLDRFSGLLSLGIIVAIYSSFVIREKVYVTLLLVGAILAIPVCFLIIKKFFRDFLPGFWSTFIWGAVVQLSVLFTVYCVLFAIHVEKDVSGYVFIFLVAAIASVLPISVGGGLGVRELVIVEAAKYTGLDQHVAPVVSILFYLVTLVCSLIGAIVIFRDPLKTSTAPSPLQS